ncbi:FxLYD domain-containing protein [Paraburkholderia bannensis]|uniref:FxLYD domain-containing protein n=1 Tax=Paraburkholderia bannensis TaxID=765414 RepID=UPI002AB20A23|nr:FxLYD domain-containing protein [Paraburkholderia bannensis]
MRKVLFASALALASMASLASISALAQGALQLSDLRGVVDPGGVTGYISGIATNTSGARIDNATITINLLNAQGEILGTTSVSGAGIAPGQHWRFRAPTSVPYDQSVVAMVKTS